jgi:hypothetical protein
MFHLKPLTDFDEVRECWVTLIAVHIVPLWPLLYT